jgi:hypothetical protein
MRHEEVTPFLRVRMPPCDFAPAGSNRSGHGGNEVAEAFGLESHSLTWRDAVRNASERWARLEKGDLLACDVPYMAKCPITYTAL